MSGIVGHEKALKKLKTFAQNPGRSYLFLGDSGLGKKTAALWFARLTLCESEIRPCEKCFSCRVSKDGNHPDIFLIEPTKRQSVGIENVREDIIPRAAQGSYRGAKRFFIIDGAPTPAAQNALLKTIEESLTSVFIFVAEKPLLPTVVSRSVSLKFNPLSDDELALALGEGANPEIIEFAQGNPALAFKLLESKEFSDIRALCKILASGFSVSQAFKFLPQIEKTREQIYIFLDVLSVCLKLKGAYKSIESVFRANKALRQNAHFQTTILSMLLELRSSF